MRPRLLVILCFFTGIMPMRGQKLLFCSEYFNPSQKEFIAKNQLTNVFVIYQDKIVNTKTNEFTREAFIKSITTTIPDKSASGFGIIDLENEDYHIITSGRQSDFSYKPSVDKFLEILYTAKKIRPNIKWSFFGINPSRFSYTSDVDYNQTMKALMPILKKIDFLSPDLYYTDNSIVNSKNTTLFTYLDINIRRSIKLGILLAKPVYPFVWHRYSAISDQKSSKILEKSLFREYIKCVIGVIANNRKVDGIIWWNAESFAWANRTKDYNYKKEFKFVKEPLKYQIDLLQDYLNIISPLFSKGM